MYLYVRCPTGIHKAKDEECLWERLASDLWDHPISVRQAPPCPHHLSIAFCFWNLFWHPLSYVPFLHLPHKCPWSHPDSRGECGTHHIVVSMFTNIPSLSIQGLVSVFGEKPAVMSNSVPENVLNYLSFSLSSVLKEWQIQSYPQWCCRS